MRSAVVGAVAFSCVLAASLAFTPAPPEPSAAPSIIETSNRVDRQLVRVPPSAPPTADPTSASDAPSKAGAPLGTLVGPAVTETPAPAPVAPRADGDFLAIASVTAIPTIALQAYVDAADWAAQKYPGCHIEWQYLAAFGLVESNHGRHAGSSPAADGTVSPAIYGPATAYGHAVGPMQFLESTWAVYGAGGNPQNLFDATKAAATYLCYGGRNLATDAARRAAAFSYNHADWYVAMIISAYTQYLAGHQVTSLPAPPPGTVTDDPTTRDNGSTPQIPATDMTAPPNTPETTGEAEPSSPAEATSEPDSKSAPNEPAGSSEAEPSSPPSAAPTTSAAAPDPSTSSDPEPTTPAPTSESEAPADSSAPA